MAVNEYISYPSVIKEVIKHTDVEYTFRMTHDPDDGVKPGQFYELSLPKFGEAPISVSGIDDGLVDFTIRKIGVVTNEIFEHYVGQTILIRGPYGNGFDVEQFHDKELLIIAGGTGVSPVRGVIKYFAEHPEKTKGVHLIAGFKNTEEILFKDDFKDWREKLDVITTLDEGEETDELKVGLVTKYIPDIDIKDPASAEAIVVGPPAMIKFSAAGLADTGFPEEHIWISQSRRMCCGLGKCGHCRVNDTYICQDGPVFNYTKGKLLVD